MVWLIVEMNVVMENKVFDKLFLQLNVAFQSIVVLATVDAGATRSCTTKITCLKVCWCLLWFCIKFDKDNSLL